MAFHLSKSRFLSGIQCPKRLYLEVHQPELAEEDDNRDRIISQGEKVGEVARQLFPHGKLIAYREDLSDAIAETHHFLQQSLSSPIYEATFSHHGVLVRSDIICSDENGLRLIEVKSSTSVKDYHLWDCAVQAWVIAGSGYPLKRVEVAHVNNSFVYPGQDDYRGLLTCADVMPIIAPLIPQVPGKIDGLKHMLQGDIPPVDIGDHCNDPWDCPFHCYCNPDPPEYPVASLPRVGRQVKEDLKARGIDDIRQIPAGYLTNPLHEKIWRLTLASQSEVSPEAGAYLRTLPYPRYYLDFETIQFAVPIWPGTRPYQQLPFQWSCHIETGPGEIRHEEFLDVSGQNPVPPLASKLLDTLGDHGPIMTYGHFEKGVLNQLIAMFPNLAMKLSPIIDRLVDLLPLTRKNYYHPQMKGSWSLKNVLPSITPEISYANLTEVQDGNDAQCAFLEAIDESTDQTGRKALQARLLEYCGLDSLALIKISNFFQQNIFQ